MFAEMGRLHSRAQLSSVRSLFRALVGAASLHAGGASAQAYPDRPITVLWPSVAGSSTDTIRRALGTEVGKRLGQTEITYLDGVGPANAGHLLVHARIRRRHAAGYYRAGAAGVLRVTQAAGLIGHPNMSPQEITDRLRAERRIWEPVIHKAGIKLQ